MPQLYVILPVGGGEADRQCASRRQGGWPSQPIYHPGHPDHGLPAFPSQGLPGRAGGRPGIRSTLPAFPTGFAGGSGNSRPELPPPAVPPEYEDDLIVAVKQPGVAEWTLTAYDTYATAGSGFAASSAAISGRR